MINVGLLGLGTVGSGIVDLIDKRCKEIKIKKILVNNINKERDIDLKKYTLTDNFEEILNDKDISIIIEVTSNIEESYEYIKDALNSGKHVMTANKAIVSKYFEELSSLADKNNVAFLYEASVGGGIPVLRPLKEALELNDIVEVQGILNGTCNYILSRMVDEGLDYSEVLKIAQNLGYAESDPTADVEGHDTLRKLRILGTLGLKGTILEEDILLSGISSITAFDVEQIKKMNSTVKLIGEVKVLEDGFTAIVEPRIIRKDSHFANVSMAFNSVVFTGDNVGELMFYGSGAGKYPTANAVLSDVLDIVKGTYRKGNPLGDKELKNFNSRMKGKYYLRVSSGSLTLDDLKNITDTVLSNKDDVVVITKEVLLKDISNLISSLEVQKVEYFLARICNKGE